MNSIPMASEQTAFNQSQGGYSNQMSNYAPNMEYNQNGARIDASNRDHNQNMGRQPISSNFQHSYNPG